ncbi:MAG: hypothetical protein ACKVS9_02530 [Phycisphaerae bacterium]
MPTAEYRRRHGSLHARALFAAIITLSLVGCGPSAPPPPESVTDSAERGPIKLSVTASPKIVQIAEPIRVVITADAPADFAIELPDEKSFPEITVAAAPPPGVPLALPDGTLRWQREFTLESYAAGALDIPPTVIKYAKKGDAGETPKLDSELATGSLQVEVRSALTSQDAPTKPRDITALLAVPRRPLKPWEIAAICAAAVAVLIGGYVAYRVIRARLLRPPPPIAPEIWALNELATLEREDFFATKRVREFYYRLSEVVRSYIERKFGLAAPEMTTEEFLTRLSRDATALPYDAVKLRVFMESCDLVKYAAWQPTRDDGAGNLSAARAFIDATAAAVARLEAQRLATTADTAPPLPPIPTSHSEGGKAA